MKTRMFSTKAIAPVMLSGLLALQACGGAQSLMQNIKVSSSDATGDLMLTMKSQLNIGQLIFPSLTIPVADPKHPDRQYGTISLLRDVNGVNTLQLDVNLTLAAQLEAVSDGRLPNGNPIPIANIDELIAIKAGSKSQVYVGFSDDKIVGGVAVAVKEFDNISRYVPGINLFYDIGGNQSVKGVFGVFTGMEPGTSGLAIFFDATKAALGTPSPTINTVFASKAKVTSSQKAREQLEQRLQQLASQKKVLKVQ